MNLIEHKVIEILSPPYKVCGLWCVDVRYNSYGWEKTGTINGLTKEEADRVAPGYVFLA